MTIETARNIKNGIALKSISAERRKEAEAILRGGMHICVKMEDGSRKYIWLKVLPTATDEESSIELAISKYHCKKCPTKESEKVREATSTSKKTLPEERVQAPQDADIKLQDISSLSLLTFYLKRKLYKLAKILDEYVDE